jgi:beta-phosphoglucomutase-like phosphatase (HAD superfamily)
MNQPIETLLFDFGGTLDADGVAWKERFHKLYCAEGLDLAADAFAPSFYAADSPLVGSLPSTTDLSQTVQALTSNLEVILSRRCTENNGPEKIHRQGDSDRGQRVASRFLSDASAAFARNQPVLKALSEHYHLGIVSNFYGNLEAVCHYAGLAPLFAVMVDSHRVGVEKPDPAIFRAALEALGAKPETTVFVGDSLRRDREGARRTGMRFIWIAPQEVQAAEGQTRIEPAVTELRGLMKILR